MGDPEMSPFLPGISPFTISNTYIHVCEIWKNDSEHIVKISETNISCSLIEGLEQLKILSP